MVTVPFARCLPVVLAVAASALVCAPDASAQRRPRLSEDLVQRLARGDAEATQVIVTATQSRVDRIAARHRLRVRARLATGAVLEVPAGGLAMLAEDEEADVLSEDQVVRPHMAVTNAAIGADLVQAGLVPGAAALTGAGVTVAVLDTGVAGVPELKGRLLASVDFTDERGNGADRFGHGTHVAGIVAGGGSAAHAGTVGVAPGAGIVNVKVLDDSGMGRVSDVIAGIDWTIAHASRFDIRVVTLAMGAVMT